MFDVSELPVGAYLNSGCVGLHAAEFGTCWLVTESCHEIL
jgi:hypothetical protein